MSTISSLVEYSCEQVDVSRMRYKKGQEIGDFHNFDIAPLKLARQQPNFF